MKISPLRTCPGFTLVELMVVVAILGILMSLVLPNYGSLIAERSVAAETKRMIGILKLARSEARARGATVTASRLASGDWAGEVEVFESTTSVGNASYAGVTAGTVTDDLIKQVSQTGRSITSRDNATTDGDHISFNMRGWLSSGETSDILIAVCSPAIEESKGNYIEINRVGKIRERPIGNDTRGCFL